MVPCSGDGALPGPIRKAVLALLGRRGRPERQPLLPPFAARLCQGKPATDLRTPSAPLAPALQDCSRRLAPTALIRKSGHGQQSVVPLAPLAPQLPAHRAGLSPLAPEGEDNHPGDGVPAPPSAPRIRNHNIIPSGLCNSRRHRHLSAQRVSVRKGQKPAKTALQGVRLHNPDYVKFAPSVGCKGPTFELPGEAAADKRPPSRTSGLQARQGAAHFAHPSWERQCQYQQRSTRSRHSRLRLPL